MRRAAISMPACAADARGWPSLETLIDINWPVGL